MRIPLELPPGLFTDDTTFAASGRWADCDNVRFRLGKPQLRGGWESVISDLLGGVCRSAFASTDGDGLLNMSFGTHQTLELYQGGVLYDITPTLKYPAKDCAITATDGSTTYTVAHPGHGLATADTVIVTGDTIGRVTISGTQTITVVDADSYTFTDSAADQVKTLGASPLATTINSTKVVVTETAHNISDGTTVTIAGATAVGGITPNGSFEITVIDANSYSFNFSSAASSTATGGGSAVTVTVPMTTTLKVAPQNAFEAGEIDGTGSTGYGTGGYGVGGYGDPSTADYFPRTWSQSAWGENLIANVRGGTIYEWDADDTGVVAAPLLNAPRQCNYALVTHTRQVMALGANLEATGVYNPLAIRICDVENNTDWTTRSDNLAEEIVLPSGGRLVGGRVMGSYVVVWTQDGVYLGTYVGSSSQGWRFDAMGRNCGLIGPGAAVVFANAAFWISPDRQFWTMPLGGVPIPIDCPIREDFADNLSASQADKIVASSIGEFGEVRWDYPDARDGIENSRYIVLQVSGSDAGAWSRGVQARTAMVDAGPSLYPCGVTYDGNIYWHERGTSADGGAMSGYIQTADMYLDPNVTAMIRGVWPDFESQVGPTYVTIETRFKPQGDVTTKGPYTMAVGDDKVDVRAKGRLANVKISSSSAPSEWRLGRIMLDVVQTGQR